MWSQRSFHKRVKEPLAQSLQKMSLRSLLHHEERQSNYRFELANISLFCREEQGGDSSELSIIQKLSAPNSTNLKARYHGHSLDYGGKKTGEEKVTISSDGYALTSQATADEDE